MHGVRRTACDRLGIDRGSWVGPWRWNQYISGGVWVRDYLLNGQVRRVTLTKLQNGDVALSWVRP